VSRRTTVAPVLERHGAGANLAGAPGPLPGLWCRAVHPPTTTVESSQPLMPGAASCGRSTSSSRDASPCVARRSAAERGGFLTVQVLLREVPGWGRTASRSRPSGDPSTRCRQKQQAGRDARVHHDRSSWPWWVDHPPGGPTAVREPTSTKAVAPRSAATAQSGSQAEAARGLSSDMIAISAVVVLTVHSG
jgi:hypothetical protein